MPSWTLDNTPDQMISGVIIEIGQHIMSDDVGCGNSIISFVLHTQMNNIGRGIPLSHLDCTHGKTTSGMAGQHSSWKTKTVGRRRAWPNITALGKHKRLNDFRNGMTSWPLDSTHNQTMSGIECHNPPWTAQTNGLCRVWHVIIAFGLQIRLDKVCCGI